MKGSPELGQHIKDEAKQHLCLWFTAGATGTCLILFVPFLVKAPAAVWFALAEYHIGREVGGPLELLAYKAGFLSRIVQAYFVPVSLGMAICIHTWLTGRAGSEGKKKGSAQAGGSGCHDGSLRVGNAPGPLRILVLWIGVLAVSLVHLLTPFPYDDYQVLIFPVFAVGISTALIRALGFGQVSEGQANGGGRDRSRTGASAAGRQTALVLTVLCLCVASACSSAMIHTWSAGKRDRIWWPIKKSTPLGTLRRTAALLQSVTKPGDMLLTQDPYLAVECGLTLPRGLELGPFSYFPGWDRERAEMRHVLNREMLREVLESTDAPVAAFSEYGFAISCPSVTKLPKAEQDALWRLVEKRYRPFREVEEFGQANTKLRIYVKREN